MAKPGRPPIDPHRGVLGDKHIGTGDWGAHKLEAGTALVLGRTLTPDEQANLTKYLNLLTKWDRIHRLVGSSSPRWLIENVILDSLLFLRVLPNPAVDVADLGSGAGMPGVPIAIVRRDLRLTLIESRQKRASFLATVVRELGLGGVRVVDDRAEKVGELRASFDAVVARCAGHPRTVLEVAMDLLRPGGALVISGPPAGTKRLEGPWVAVPGIHRGAPRHFAVYRKP